MIVMYIPVLVLLIGGLLYLLAANPKVAELGRWCFILGLAACLFLGARAVKLLP